MNTSGNLGPVRSTIDTQRMEAAGRAVRRWLDTLKARIVARRPPERRDDDIAWEDGEPEDQSGGPKVM
jgi:hypothetical protein